MEGRTPYWDIKRKVIFEHLEKFKDVPSNAVAKILFRDYPEYFKDKESARSVIRRYRGKSGIKDRSHVKITKYFQNVSMA